ncbi:S-acyl fatty acid synthase thioesterase, medium chain [Perognathus longimembris pacificus]|uniref:S-acyl fatty acid synthase thioesterase, medium chain n=1 Tax=Perognathus longimembris pacificus TaxID=214514 RepID=UPI002019A13F|nr:S-acyl fatty acid synthase thioesterase, medium chain [Perognathus longimembris pacificus]
MERKEQVGRTRNENVLNCLIPRPNAMFKLICFPWAGSGSSYLAKWGEKMSDLIEVHAVRFAGRESRFHEQFASDICQQADEIIDALLPIIHDQPFAFFGHSFGSCLAFVCALHLKEKYNVEPVHMFLSSATPFHSNYWRAQFSQINQLSEEQVKHHLLELGGTPNHIIHNKDLLDQWLPIIQADISILQNSNLGITSLKTHSCDFICFVGANDIIKDMEAWKDVTSGNFDLYVLPGGHFHLVDPANEDFIHKCIIKCLELSSLVNS